MANIQNELNNIKNATFGKEVRNSIHDAIKQCYDDASVNNDNANMEVKMARGVHKTLNDRLDSVDSQLEYKANLNTIFTMANMGQDIKEAMTGGSVAVVGRNTILNDNIVGKTISKSKIYDYSKVEDVEYNLYDDADVIRGGYYNIETGLWKEHTGYSCSNFIKVSPNEVIRISAGNHVVFWDASKQYLGYVTGSSTFTTCENCYFITVAIADASINSFKISRKPIQNATDKAMYIDEKLLITNKNIGSDIKIYGDMVDFFTTEKTENLFNKRKANKNGYYNEVGKFVSSSKYISTDFIECTIGEYYARNAGIITFWDKNYNFISGLSSRNIFEVSDEKIKYFSCALDVSVLDTYMIVKGSTMPSCYVDYEKYYLKNNVITSQLVGLKWNCLGDSITTTNYAEPYHSQIGKKCNMEVRNYGVSGSRIAQSSSRTDSFYERFSQMDDDADIITIFGGTNDYKVTPLGEFDSVDVTTFYGALHSLLKGLILKYPGKRIGFITPMQRKIVSSLEERAEFKKYIQAIEEVCEYYSIPVLNLYKNAGLIPHIDIINQQFFKNADGLHPNTDGHTILARKIEKFIESL